jgi:hypothetical protein
VDEPVRSLQEEREAAIAELEQRARRRGFGIRWSTALVAMAMAVGLLWMQRADIAYFFSSRAPLTLGSEEGYRFEQLASNRYAQIHGAPTTIGAFSKDCAFAMVGLQGTPVLVKRAMLPSEECVPGHAPPQIDQRPFGVAGRLLSEADASRYAPGFDQLRSVNGVVPRDGKLWLLVAEESPGDDVWSAVLLGFLSLFILANAWFFARDIALRFGARA